MLDLWTTAGSLTAILGYNVMLRLADGWHLGWWPAHGLSFAFGIGCVVVLIALRRVIIACRRAPAHRPD